MNDISKILFDVTETLAYVADPESAFADSFDIQGDHPGDFGIGSVSFSDEDIYNPDGNGYGNIREQFEAKLNKYLAELEENGEKTDKKLIAKEIEEILDKIQVEERGVAIGSTEDFKNKEAAIAILKSKGHDELAKNLEQLQVTTIAEQQAEQTKDSDPRKKNQEATNAWVDEIAKIREENEKYLLPEFGGDNQLASSAGGEGASGNDLNYLLELNPDEANEIIAKQYPQFGDINGVIEAINNGNNPELA